MADSTASFKLALFFTRGVSLRTWADVGMFDREVVLYRALAERGVHTAFVTYGDRSELRFRDDLGGIEICCNRWGLPQRLYRSLIPVLHGKALRASHVLKTNQTAGGETALKASRVWRKPLVARGGYLWSFNESKRHGEHSSRAFEAREIESRLFSAARKIVVTTDSIRRQISERLPWVAAKTAVIPNYVETNRFRPVTSQRKKNTVIFVGRLSEEKNLHSLLAAAEPLAFELIMIGSGPLEKDLKERFGDLGGRLNWVGNVPNAELPRWLNTASIFVLPSMYEGHPKALIEAMACGLTVIGCNSPGIREIICHEENGLLCGTDPVSIRRALEQALTSPRLRETLGNKAREYTVEAYSLERIVDMELAVLHEVAGR